MTSRDLGELYELACTFVAETPRAVLIYDHATDEELWIPLSQVSSLHKGANRDGTLVMSAWIAKKKGLI